MAQNRVLVMYKMAQNRVLVITDDEINTGDTRGHRTTTTIATGIDFRSDLVNELSSMLKQPLLSSEPWMKTSTISSHPSHSIQP
jgi:hypothetical protein